MSNVSIIIRREFNERVRKKSFIVSTLLMPLLMLALMAAPALVMQFSRGGEKTVAVIDESGLIAPRLESSEEIRFETTDLTTDEPACASPSCDLSLRKVCIVTRVFTSSRICLRLSMS